MAIKQIQALHYRTPYKLLKIREYNKFFDGTAIGSMFRILASLINRRTTKELKGQFNRTSYVYATSLAYERGALACFTTDEKLAEVLGKTVKSVTSYRKTLENAKLIRYVKFGEGYIYTLGEVLRVYNEDGYSVGEEHEGLYIDRWYSWAEKDELGFQIFIMENFMEGKQSEKAVLEAYKKAYRGKQAVSNPTPNPEKDELDRQISAQIGKIFPDNGKNISQNGEFVASRSRRVGARKPAVVNTPIEVVVNEDIKEREDSRLSHTGNADSTQGTSDPNVEVQLKIVELGSVLKSKSRNLTLTEFMAVRKEAMDTIGLEAFNKQILAVIPENLHFHQSPSFSVFRSLEVNTKNPTNYLSNLILSLYLDILGRSDVAGQARSALKLASDLIKTEGIEKAIWVVERTALDQRNRTAIANNSIWLLKSFATQLTQKWNDVVKARKEAIIEQESKEASVEVKAQEAERVKAEIEKFEANVVARIENAPEKVEESWEYYDNLVRNTAPGPVRTFYIKRRNDFKKP